MVPKSKPADPGFFAHHRDSDYILSATFFAHSAQHPGSRFPSHPSMLTEIPSDSNGPRGSSTAVLGHRIHPIQPHADRYQKNSRANHELCPSQTIILDGRHHAAQRFIYPAEGEISFSLRFPRFHGELQPVDGQLCDCGFRRLHQGLLTAIVADRRSRSTYPGSLHRVDTGG